jgi:outer membrane protein TolC
VGQRAALAEALADEARSKSWPRLNVRAGARYETRDGDLLPEADGDFGDTFLELPQNAVRRRLAGMGLVCAEHIEARARCVVEARALRAYAGFLRANARLDLAEERLILADQLEAAWQQAPRDAALAERREESQALTRNQPLLHEQARLEQVLAAKRLFILAGLAESHAPIVVAPLPAYDCPPAVTAERCLAWALARRGDLLALQEQIRMQDQAIRLARMARLPSPGLSFGYRDAAGVDSDNAFEGVYLKAMLKVPLWDAGDISAQTAKLTAERTRSVLDSDDLQAEIAASVAKAYGAWRRAVETRAQTGRDKDDPADSRRRADIRRALGDLSTSQHQTELMRVREREWADLDANLACYEAEADLLEAIQADRSEWAAGLR